jgi:2,3-bisphosphoglycerate-dependent phosphoglycerate mutase
LLCGYFPYLNGRDPVAIFTHGKLLTLILKSLDNRYGYKEWSKMTNPDIFEVSKTNDEWNIIRVWKE